MPQNRTTAASLIAARASEARCATDLGLIYDTWRAQTPDGDVMRTTDHIAARKAAAALERVADALARRLTPYGATRSRSLPEIKPTTRLRKTPQRFWLEISPGDTVAPWNAQTVLFVEFSKTSVRLGLRLPLNGQPLGRDTVRALRPFKPDEPMDATDWHLEHRKAPATPAACTADVNDWLAARHKSRQHVTTPLTLSKCCTHRRPTMNELTTGLAEAATLIQDAICGDTVMPASLTASRALPVSAMT